MSEGIVATFGNKLRELSNSTSEKDVLTEMKSIVLNNDKQVLMEIVQNCSLNPVFDCLNSTDDEQIDLCCIIIYNLLKDMNASHCLASYNKLLLRALGHPSTQIKITVLKLLNGMINDGVLQKLASEYPSLLIQACESVGHSDRSVAQCAIALLTTIGMTHAGLEVLYSRILLEKFREVMLINDIARFRVFEIVAAVSQKTDEGLQASQDSGLLNLLLQEIKSDDTLLQLNALEILSCIGSSPHGYKYLEECGVIQYLSGKLLKLEDEPLSFVLLPGLIEFFGNICKEDPPHFISHHPEVLNLLFSSLETQDEVLLGVIYSTVGKVGSTNCGKIALNRKPEQMQNVFKKAGELLSHKNDTTVSIMHSLSELLTLSDDNKDELDSIPMTWFNCMGPNALEAIFNLAKLPFIELRLSALTLVNAIAKWPWGVEKICQYPGMCEYLTDRSTEYHKDCKSAKYDIVCSLANSQILSNFLTEENINKIKEYVNEGPYYVPTLSPEMMTEGAS